MAARWGTLAVPINENNHEFWYKFKRECQDRGVPYARAVRQAVEMWLGATQETSTGSPKPVPQSVKLRTDPFIVEEDEPAPRRNLPREYRDPNPPRNPFA